MVNRRRQARRKNDQAKACKFCVSVLLAISLVVGPTVWERVTSIAGRIMNASSSTDVVKNHIRRGG